MLSSREDKDWCYLSKSIASAKITDNMHRHNTQITTLSSGPGQKSLFQNKKVMQVPAQLLAYILTKQTVKMFNVYTTVAA